MSFTPRDWRTILVDKVAYIVSNTPLTAINPGSTLATALEATSMEDGEQYFQMLEIIRNYSLNTTTGEDLDRRAKEFGLERFDPKNSTSIVSIGDSGVTKVTTTIYSGLPGPKAGSTTVYTDSSTGFLASGSIVIGRDTNNVETVTYSSITSFANYVRFNLGSSLTNDHGTDEGLILSQGG